MSRQHIDSVLDAYFAFMANQAPYAMAQPAEIIPTTMIDMERPLEDDDEYLVWKPIPSTVDEAELAALETFLGHQLPVSYRHFLQKLHFLSIYLDQNQLSFFPSFPGQLASGFDEIITGYYSDLPGRGYVPFANYGDWGVACFDANVQSNDNEYPVVIFDHEDGYVKPIAYASGFEDLFAKVAHGQVFQMPGGWQVQPH